MIEKQRECQIAKLANVIITDKHGKTVLNKAIYPLSIQSAAIKFSELHKDCYVKIQADGKEFALTPINMRKDEYKMSTGEMDLEDFMAKWMPSKKKLSKKLIEKELAEAFSQDDDIDFDPFEHDKPYEDCD